MSRKIIHFEFSQDLVKEPLLYQLTRKFDIQTNIRAASVTEEGGYVVLEIIGDDGVVDSALSYLRESGAVVTEREE